MANGPEKRSVDWVFPKLLTAPDIERWVSQLPKDSSQVVLDIQRWRRTAPFADARLQGALCILHRMGIATIARIPDDTFEGVRAEHAFADPDPLAPHHLSVMEKRLSGTCAGLVIGQLCAFEGGAHGEIARLQLETLKRRRYLFGWGPEISLVGPSSPSSTGDPRSAPLIREARINERLLDLLAPLGSSKKFEWEREDWFSELKTFAFEATENTWDHGRLDFDSRPINSVRFVRLRRFDVGERGYNAQVVAPGFETEFGEYLRFLNAATDLVGRWSKDGGRLLEITIADGGVGIASKMAGDFDVFNSSIERELKLVRQALLPKRSTKPPGEVGRGQGFRKMLRACHQLSGLVIVRTGRLRLTRTYRLADGGNEGVDFMDEASRGYEPKVGHEPLPLIAGTAVSLIFPIGHPSTISRSETA